MATLNIQQKHRTTTWPPKSCHLVEERRQYPKSYKPVLTCSNVSSTASATARVRDSQKLRGLLEEVGSRPGSENTEDAARREEKTLQTRATHQAQEQHHS